MTRFGSDWAKAVGVVSYLKRLSNKNKPKTIITSVAERQESEIRIFREVQRTAFEDGITRLSNQGGIRKLMTNSPVLKLDPFLDDHGLLRVGGRLEKSTLPLELKHPIILPRSSHVTDLIIGHFHEKVRHQGKGITMNEIRSNGLWVRGLSAAVSSQIHKCVRCRRQRRSTEGQKIADLPQERVESTPPFMYCGMDCFGPFIVREGRKDLKRYGVIFTCMSSRAVRIEELDDMTTDAFTDKRIKVLHCHPRTCSAAKV